MTAKTSAARRRAFCAALAETGNQTVAAERAKVSRSWVSLHRATDPAFRAELDAAVATARERLRGAAGVGPAAKSRALAGEELAVRGTNGRRVQLARARLKQWTPRLEARFIAALGQAANVKATCAAVGLSIPSAYGHRQRRPAFARRWDEAVGLGRARLEFALLNAAGRCLDPGFDRSPEVELPVTGMDADQAIRLWRLRGKKYAGNGGRVGGPAKTVSMEEVGRVILARVKQSERVRAWQEAGGDGSGAARRRGRGFD